MRRLTEREDVGRRRAAKRDDAGGKQAEKRDNVEGKRAAEADGSGMKALKSAGVASPASPAVTGPQGGWNQRKTMLLLMAFSVVLLAAVTVAG